MACTDQNSSSLVLTGIVCSRFPSKYLHGMLPRAVFPVFVNRAVCTAAYAVCADLCVLLAGAILKDKKKMEIYNSNPSAAIKFDERRIKSGVMMVLAVFVAAKMPTPMFGLSLLISVGWLSFLEWSELCFGKDFGKKHPFVIFLATGWFFERCGAWLASISGGIINDTSMLAWCLACCAGIVLIALNQRSPEEKFRPIMQTGWLGGLVCVAIFFIGAVIQYAAFESMLATHESSVAEWLFWVFLVALIDSAGYLVGKSVDSKQGILSISPKKTVAGTLAMIIMPFFGLFWLWAEPPLAYAVVVGVVALWGDLWLSLIKRVRGVKDTGQTIPGHGGVLDRLDSHIMVWACLGLLRKLTSLG